MGPGLGSVSAMPRRAAGSTGAPLPALPLALGCMRKPGAEMFHHLRLGRLKGSLGIFRVCTKGKKKGTARLW